MAHSHERQQKRSAAPLIESLESRNLMSVLINAKPTLEVVPSGNRVRATANGGINITQPTPIIVTGTAQPPAANVQVVVQIFARDANANVINGGRPLATAVPDQFGRYTATLVLPSQLRKDVNTLVAREVAVGSLVSNVALSPTTLSGLTANTTVNGTALRDLAAALDIDPTALSNLTATINNPASTTTLNGTIVTSATPISGIGATITIPAFPTSAGTAGPAVGTLLGGTGTLGAQVGTLVGGTGTTAASTSTLTQTGTAFIAGTDGTLAQTGTAPINPTTGTLTQTGSAAVAGTNGTSTLNLEEVAVSEPLTVFIHQGPGRNGSNVQAQSRSERGRSKVLAPIGLRQGVPRPSAIQRLAVRRKGR